MVGHSASFCTNLPSFELSSRTVALAQQVRTNQVAVDGSFKYFGKSQCPQWRVNNHKPCRSEYE